MVVPRPDRRRRRRARGASCTPTGCETLDEDASRERIEGAEAACEHVRETWRAFEEFNIAPQLALDALFVRLHGELGGASSPPS